MSSIANTLHTQATPLREPEFSTKPEKTQLKAKFEKFCKKASKWHGTINAVVIGINDIVKTTEFFRDLPKAGYGLTMGMSAFSCVDIVFAVPRSISAIKDLFTAETAFGRVSSLLKSVTEIATVASEAIWILRGLEKLALVGKDVVSWTPVASIVILPFQFVYLPITMYNTYNVNKVRLAIQRHFKNPAKLETEEKRLKNCYRSLTFVVEKHVEIKEKLSISKKADVRGLAIEKLTVLREFEEKKPAEKEAILQDTEAFLSELRCRARVRVVLDTASVIVSVASFALSIAFICSPAAPAIPALLIATGVSGLALLALDTVMTDSNPFEVKKDTFYRRSVTKFRSIACTATRYIYKAAKFVTVKPVRFAVKETIKGVFAAKAYVIDPAARRVAQNFSGLAFA